MSNGYRIYQMQQIRKNIKNIRSFFASQPYSTEDLDIDLEVLDAMVDEIRSHRSCEYAWQIKRKKRCDCDES